MKELFVIQFQYYKDLGEKTFGQVPEEKLFWKYNEASNSIATIVKHLSENLQSCWTNFLIEVGKNTPQIRTTEFKNEIIPKEEMVLLWEKGWTVLFDALNQISDENIMDIILIREEKRNFLDAILRQFAHCSYHIGQIIYIGKMIQNENWKTLQIVKNKSTNDQIAKVKNQNSAEIQENSSPVCYAKSDEVRDDYKI